MDQSNSPFLTQKSLWEGFATDGSLQISKMNELRFDKITYGEYYFSGREVGGERVRIFGVYVTPDEKKCDGAILYVSDVSQSINYEVVNEYAKMGYSVLAIDLYGKKSGVENYTSYPEAISYANYELRGRRMDYVDTNARETCWYEWVAVARYALSFLEGQAGVKKIGVVGEKNGANVVWQLAATDKRVQCAVMLFGAGWSAYKGVFRYSDVQSDIIMDEERRRFIAAVDAHAYAQNVTCPIFFLSSTNSERFDFDRSFDTLSRVPEQTQCSFNFAPSFNEYLDTYCRKDVEYFLKKHLDKGKANFPSAPELKIDQDGRCYTVEVSCAEEEQVVECKVFFNEGVVDPALRNWKPCEQIEGRKTGFEYVLSGNPTSVFAFAVVRYKSGVTLSSRLVHKRIEQSSAVKSGIIYTSKDGLDGVTFYDKNLKNDQATFIKREDFLELVKGPEGIDGAYSLCGLISYKFSEPGCRIDENSILKLDVFTDGFCVIRLVVMQKTADEFVEYVYTIELNSGDLWKNHVVKMGDFKTAEGRGIKKFDGIYALRIEGEGKYAVNNILLI